MTNMKQKILGALLGAVLLSVVAPCSAEMESDTDTGGPFIPYNAEMKNITMGPFAVSFDLDLPKGVPIILPVSSTYGEGPAGINSDWEWELHILEWVGQTKYDAFIRIRETNYTTAWDPASALETLNQSMDLTRFVSQNRTITKIGDREVITYLVPYASSDTAFTSISDNPTRYGCAFIPEIQGTDVVVVTVTSSFPWGLGTEKLFNSIKVERIGATVNPEL